MSMMSDGGTRCFKEGLEARDRKETLADNPYVIGTEEHESWAAGWQATCDLDEDRDPESTRVPEGDEE